MAVTADLNVGNTTVNIPLVDDGGGTLFAADLGKPEVDLRTSGALYPRGIDNWSGLQNLTCVGRFTDSNAYADAATLIDLIQSDFGSGNTMTLNVGLPEYDDNMLVAPAAGQESAVSVTYEPGRRNEVLVDASFTRIGNVESVADRTATTPTASGSGPIELTANNTTVSISTDVTVTRETGRPNDVIRAQPQADFPLYYNKGKSVTETITLEFEFTDDPVADLQAIGQNIFRQRLGRGGIELNFNGLYGLGAFTVVPVGSAPFRQARRAGYEGMSRVPTFTFTRIYDSN
jgi:predicted nucleic acid-binding Zn ribbon protein